MKPACFFYVCLAVITALGCHRSLTTPADSLVVGIDAFPETLDPRSVLGRNAVRIAGLTHNGLFRWNERFEAVPDLAEAYETPDPLTYRFHLRPGVFFHNGRVLSADDVDFTLQSVLNGRVASPYRHVLGGVIDGVDVLDPLTLDIRLKEPYSPLPSLLTLGILPAGTSQDLAGTGPYRVESVTERREIVLRRNENSFRGAPRIGRVVFKVIPDLNVRMAALREGGVDVLQGDLPASFLRRFAGNRNFVVETTEGSDLDYLALNVRRGPLAKPDVRRAVAMALDLPSMMAYRTGGLARAATGLLSPMHWAYTADVDRWPHDPEAARKLFDEAGYADPDGDGPRPRFSLIFKAPSEKESLGLARLVVRSLAEVGVDARVVPVERDAFWRDVSDGSFDLCGLSWKGLSDPDIFYHVFHSSQIPPAGANRTGYASELVDQLTGGGRRVTLASERGEVYREVQKILARELPVIPLWHEPRVAVFSRRVKGLKLRPDDSFGWAGEVWKE